MWHSHNHLIELNILQPHFKPLTPKEKVIINDKKKQLSTTFLQSELINIKNTPKKTRVSDISCNKSTWSNNWLIYPLPALR